MPRTAARVETIGPFTLFVNKHSGGFPYYARPSLGASEFAVDDVNKVRERQRQLDIPETFEWVHETTPALASATLGSGLALHRHPLQVLEREWPVSSVEGITIRLVTADEADLARISAVSRIAFGSPGTAVGEEGPETLELARPDSVDDQRQRLRDGLTITAAAFTAAGDPVGSGSHQPVGDVSEIVGVGTLPAFRRRGIGAALTALLVRDALQRVRTVFLSAGDDDVARMYERVGFRRVATACIAEP
ncbi:MAG TPA: GNAT family N-acetyltransferase [Chloroflexota bacterium]|nr:GNAT family N-acetyltransferase [Chloroflexota bacterium]